MQEKIIIGSDHAGFELKNIIINHLKEKNIDVTDIGICEKKSCDYPLIAKQLATQIVKNEYQKGILICGTGIGMSIMANRIKGFRASVVSDTCSAKMSRLHNDSNVLCFGERIVGKELAKDITDIWLSTEFLAERHKTRIDMLDN